MVTTMRMPTLVGLIAFTTVALDGCVSNKIVVTFPDYDEVMVGDVQQQLF